MADISDVLGLLAPYDVTVLGVVGCWVQSFASSAMYGAVALFDTRTSYGDVTKVGRRNQSFQFAFTETRNRLRRQQMVHVILLKRLSSMAFSRHTEWSCETAILDEETTLLLRMLCPYLYLFPLLLHSPTEKA